MLNRKLNIRLRHSLNSHCIPSIIINNTVRSFQRSVMNTRALFPLLFTVASFSASAGNWAVKNGWCQTMTEDGQALVMLKNGTIGITGLMQGCPNGVQTLLGSRISINGNLIPTSQMCNQQTGFRAVEVEVGQAPEMVKKAVHSIAERDVSVLQAFGVRMEFRVLYLNNQNKLIAGETLFTGTINRTEVHPREVIKRALYHNAAAVVLAHNHPSGEVTPSKADRLITERLVQALGLVDIRVPDHLIVGGSQVFSFAEHGLL
uniref:Putative intergenic-region protein n=4 Tax=Escherichia coli TaxID=562 RepID=Q8VR59_ECOLX|nr:putative intergenic-region protein [Escherichia coli]